MGVAVAGSVLVAERGEAGRRLFVPLLVQAVVCAVVSMFLLEILGALAWERMFEGVSTASFYLLMVSLLPGQIILAVTGFLTGREHFPLVSSLGMVQWGGYLLAVVGASLMTEVDLPIAIICFLGPAWLAAGFGLVVSLWDSRRFFSLTDLWKVFAFGWRSQLAQVLNLLQMRLDMILLRLLTTPEQLGFYAVGTNLSEWMLYLPRATQQVAMPLVARNQEISSRIYGWLFGIMGLAALGVGVFSPWLVLLFFGSDYLAAVPVVQVILPGTVLLGLGTLAMGVLFGRRETGFLSRSGLVVVLGFLIADLWAIPRWGAFGAALVSSVLYSVYTWVLLRRVFSGKQGELRACFIPSLPWRRPGE